LVARSGGFQPDEDTNTQNEPQTQTIMEYMLTSYKRGASENIFDFESACALGLDVKVAVCDIWFDKHLIRLFEIIEEIAMKGEKW
jgi:hypothetical protein